MKFKSILLLIALIFISFPAFAATFSQTALKSGIGTRPLGMGGAFTALANDASAIFYNPAGLYRAGVGYSYGDLDASQDQYRANYNLFKLGFLGFGTWYYKNPADENILVSDLGFGAKRGWMSWGIGFKTVRAELGGGARKENWSTDLGFLFRITPQFTLGLTAQDLLASKDFIVNSSTRLGMAYQPFDKWLALAADMEIDPERSKENLTHFGMEAKLAEGFSVRGGFDKGTPTAGLSLLFPLFVADYAVQFQPNKNIQRFEMGIKFFVEGQRPFSLIRPKEYALIDLRGVLTGGGNKFSLFGGRQIGTDAVIEEIKNAVKDPAIDGIVIRLGGDLPDLAGPAIVQEIRSELKKAREKGKKIIVYVEGSAVGDEYYLASVADKIIAPPGAMLGGLGKSLYLTKITGLFDKIGVDYQVFTQGKYKDTFSPYSKSSEKQKEKVRDLVADLYRQMITDIANDRGKKISDIKTLGDGSVFGANEALRLGLIDEIGYFDAVREVAAEIMGSTGEASIVKSQQVEPEETLNFDVFRVAVIEIDGEIVDGQSGSNYVFGGDYVGSDTVVDYIRQAADDNFVKAIILRINSPGGSAVAGGDIYQELLRAKEKDKVIIASMGPIAASAGYMIALPADKIMADPASITGSIGVISGYPVVEKLYKLLSIEAEAVKEGKHSDMFSGLRKMTPLERAKYESIMKENYNEFVGYVLKHRVIPTAEVFELAQGQVFTGSQAKEKGLVDELGGFSDAVELVKQTAQLRGEPNLIYYRQPALPFQVTSQISQSLGLPTGFWQQLLLKQINSGPL